ncbi:energy transducer TonB [Parabacteroides sp. FAFU027]|uniref:energy transducer TonB n=1 Tax=Parabacteroides sp. FAFU027 TaxID=2922715 RepID=UPI001FAEDB28|nr:energy transducer TonB [Parabacteroides sp. FAFU027]
MSRKIQFHTFHLLFRLFSYLADKSGGWSMFVRPKLMVGALIVGVTACNVKTGKNPEKALDKQKSDSAKERRSDNDSEENDGSHVFACYSIAGLARVENTDDNNGPYIIVDQMPEFPGGRDAMNQFIDKKLIYPPFYPPLDKMNKVEGMVICTFVINKDGAISDINVVRGINPRLDAEAVRLISIMPKWIPGKQGGKAVPVKYTLPIRFTLPPKK